MKKVLHVTEMKRERENQPARRPVIASENLAVCFGDNFNRAVTLVKSMPRMMSPANRCCRRSSEISFNEPSLAHSKNCFSLHVDASARSPSKKRKKYDGVTRIKITIIVVHILTNSFAWAKLIKSTEGMYFRRQIFQHHLKSEFC